MSTDWFKALALPQEPGLEAALVAFIARARAPFPDIAIDDASFARHLAVHLSRDGEPIAPQLAMLHAEDLFLACACARGDARAQAHFEARYFATLDAVCRSFRGLPEEIGDVRQTMRERFFLPKRSANGDAHEPRLARYRGEGELGAWVRVSITRYLINRTAREEPETSADVFDSLMAESDGPELQLLKRTCADALKLAFEDALTTLSARQTNLLRYQLVDELRADEIARIYRVHRSTVMRWQAETRDALERAMRASLAKRVHLSPEEFESFVRAALSGFDLTLTRYLARRG